MHTHELAAADGLVARPRVEELLAFPVDALCVVIALVLPVGKAACAGGVGGVVKGEKGGVGGEKIK